MMYLSIALYMLGSLMVLTFMEPEDEGHDQEMKVLAMFWPFFTILAMAHEIFGGDKE